MTKQGSFALQSKFVRGICRVRVWLALSFPLIETGPLAEPWRRLLAATIDTTMLLLSGAIVLLIFIARNTNTDVLEHGTLLLSPLLCWFYAIACWSTGATFGMRAVGIRIVRIDGRRMDIATSLVRTFGYIVACLPVKAGLFPILTHPLRQGWHDQLARTLVVKNGATPDVPVPRMRLSDPAPISVDIREGLRGWGWALAYCVGLTLAFTYPVARHFTTSTAGLRGDSSMFMWGYWYFSYAIFRHESLTSTHMLFYPENVSLLFHTMDWFNCAVGSVLLRFFGIVTVYNILWIGSISLTTFTTYVLLASITRCRTASAVIAPVYGLSSFMMLEGFGHANLISAEFLPLFALTLYAAIVGRRLVYGVAAGILLGLAGLCDFQFLLFGAVLASGLFAGLWSRKTPACRSVMLHQVKVIGIAFVVAGLMVSWLTVPAALIQRGARYMNASNQSASNRAELINFLTFSPLSLSQRHSAPVTGDGGPMFVKTEASTSLLAMALAALALLFSYRRLTAWTSALVFALILSNGPTLSFGVGEPLTAVWLVALGFPGNGFSLPWNYSAFFEYMLQIISRPESLLSAGTVVVLPYSYLPHLIPMMRAFRAPVRMQEDTLLCLAVLAAYGLTLLLRGGVARFGKCAAIVLVCACAVILTYELLPVPYPVTPWRISPFFNLLARDRTEYAVVNIPLSSIESMMIEPAIHHKAVFDGHLARVPRNANDLISTNLFLQYCTLTSSRGLGFEVPRRKLTTENLRLALLQLRHVGARYVILHKQECKDVAGSEDMLEEKLQLPIVWDDAIIRAYRIPADCHCSRLSR